MGVGFKLQPVDSDVATSAPQKSPTTLFLIFYLHLDNMEPPNRPFTRPKNKSQHPGKPDLVDEAGGVLNPRVQRSREQIETGRAAAKVAADKKEAKLAKDRVVIAAKEDELVAADLERHNKALAPKKAPSKAAISRPKPTPVNKSSTNSKSTETHIEIETCTSLTYSNVI